MPRKFRRMSVLHAVTESKIKCLKCDDLFGSVGNWNRLCKRCNTENAAMDLPIRESRMVDNGGRVIHKSIEAV